MLTGSRSRDVWWGCFAYSDDAAGARSSRLRGFRTPVVGSCGIAGRALCGKLPGRGTLVAANCGVAEWMGKLTLIYLLLPLSLSCS